MAEQSEESGGYGKRDTDNRDEALQGAFAHLDGMQLNRPTLEQFPLRKYMHSAPSIDDLLRAARIFFHRPPSCTSTRTPQSLNSSSSTFAYEPNGSASVAHAGIICRPPRVQVNAPTSRTVRVPIPPLVSELRRIEAAAPSRPEGRHCGIRNENNPRNRQGRRSMTISSYLNTQEEEHVTAAMGSTSRRGTIPHHGGRRSRQQPRTAR